jgi:hypothetical protein
MWLLLVVVLLIVLSVLFGGFQKGAKVNGLGYRASVIATSDWTLPCPIGQGAHECAG